MLCLSLDVNNVKLPSVVGHNRRSAGSGPEKDRCRVAGSEESGQQRR